VGIFTEITVQQIEEQVVQHADGGHQTTDWLHETLSLQVVVFFQSLHNISQCKTFWRATWVGSNIAGIAMAAQC